LARKTSRKTSRKKASSTRSAGARKRRKRSASKGGGQELELAIVPVRNLILFPGVAMPLMLGRDASVRAVQAAVQSGEPVGLLLQHEEGDELPTPSDLYQVGTMGELLRYWTEPDGRHQAICHGNARFRVIEFTATDPYMRARVEIMPVVEPTRPAEVRKIEARTLALRQAVQEVLALSPGAPEGFEQEVQALPPSALVDLVACLVLDVPATEKQAVLEQLDLETRLDDIQRKLGDHLELLRLSHKIRQDTKGSLDQAQREYVLREQLRSIQRELGDGGAEGELVELRARLEELQLPDPARKEAERELDRLSRTPEQSSEHSMLRTWLETFVELPWSEMSKDKLDLAHARRVLDEDHCGLEKVKRRILEFLAVRKLNPSGGGQTLCLVGPPGVGKTSLGQSVARALGREFVRISLGGVHDEAEVRGHRRTYVGAMMGKILEGFRRAGTRNPVFVLDELDKLGAGVHGDPASALLEVLDPAQNHTFRDNYLGAEFDVSRALFIGTANVLWAIPRALRDRLEVLELPGYTGEEKLQIASQHLVRRQVAECGLEPSQLKITRPALRELIRSYSREAGVRELERTIGSLARHAATLFVGRRRKPFIVGVEEVHEVLGPPRYESEVKSRTRVPGVATGLAWTPVGGEILFVESLISAGKGELKLTGQLGDVMRESAIAALSLVKSRADAFGIDLEALEKSDLHIHIPAGSVQKDGPSAGVALYLSLVSMFTGRAVRPDVAMTGEVSLRGLVLPVGGIKEKVLAALAAGIKTVMLPRRNEADLIDVPESARARLEFVLLDEVDEAVESALVRGRTKRR